MHRAFSLALLLTTFFFAGCGGSGAKGGKPVFKAGGTVQLQGVGIKGATVTFSPLDGQPTAYAATDAEGNYQLTTYDYGDGAAEGNYKVTVQLQVAPPSSSSNQNDANHEANEMRDHDSSGKSNMSLSLVPQRYTSKESTPLSAEVTKSGDNVFDLVLEAN